MGCSQPHDDDQFRNHAERIRSCTPGDNHEAVHVAQSCNAGGVGSAGAALGIGTSGEAALALQHEVYEGVSEEEKQMELEAYTLTKQTGAGINAAVDHCST